MSFPPCKIASIIMAIASAFSCIFILIKNVQGLILFGWLHSVEEHDSHYEEKDNPWTVVVINCIVLITFSTIAMIIAATTVCCLFSKVKCLFFPFMVYIPFFLLLSLGLFIGVSIYYESVDIEYTVGFIISFFIMVSAEVVIIIWYTRMEKDLEAVTGIVYPQYGQPIAQYGYPYGQPQPQTQFQPLQVPAKPEIA